MKWRNGLGWTLAAVVLLQGCTKKAPPNTPEGTLENYVQVAFNAKKPEDRERLVSLTTGEAEQFLREMTNEDFQKRYVANPMVLSSLKMKDLRQDQSGDVSLVYEIAFKDGKTPNAVEQTNRKIAYLTRNAQGEWKIKATKNVKSVIERKDDLVVTPESAEKENPPGKK